MNPILLKNRPHFLNVLAVVLLAALSGCTEVPKSPPKTEPAVESKALNDYPTLTRVEFVLECMKEQGGQTYDNLYHCACAVDKVAERMSHEEYAQAQTFTHMFNTPGERGAEFRDPPQSAKLRNALKEAKVEAAAACFLKPKRSVSEPAK